MAGFNCPQGSFDRLFITESEFVDRYVGAKLYNWGINTYGQIGDNSVTPKSSPVQTIAGGTNWKYVVGGIGGIKTDGTLWTWGYNGYGSLGDNSVIPKSSPVQTIAGGTNWKYIAQGSSNHMAGIKTDGTLWLWGANWYGQLGDNSIIDKSSPVQVFGGGTDWKQVACGNTHTAAIKNDGTLWIWGGSPDFGGILGTNEAASATKSSPVQTIAGGTNWKEVSCGNTHTAAIKTDGTLWAWGWNGNGQIGNISLLPVSSPVQTIAGGTDWKQVSCGGNSTSAIKIDGTLWLWGANTYGNLGDNSIGSKSSPVQTIAGGTDWKQVSCGWTTAAIKTDGRLWTWGYNVDGQLGDGTTTNKSSPIQIISGDNNWKQISASNQTIGGIILN